MSIEMIRPRMIRTDQRLLSFTLPFYDLMSAVLTDVIKGMKHVLVVADTKEPLSCDLKTEVISGVHDLREMAGVLPGPGKKFTAFFLVNRFARVIGRIQGDESLITLGVFLQVDAKVIPTLVKTLNTGNN